MEILRREKLTMNLFKCIFVTDSVIFLAFVVSADGLKVDQDKVQAIVEWPRPKTIGEVRTFHGFLSAIYTELKDRAGKRLHEARELRMD